MQDRGKTGRKIGIVVSVVAALLVVTVLVPALVLMKKGGGMPGTTDTAANEYGQGSVEYSVAGIADVSPSAGGLPGAAEGVSGGSEGSEGALPEGMPSDGAGAGTAEVPVLENPPCDFSTLVGQTAEEARKAIVGRPSRVLPLGSMATQDYSHSRVNLDLDENGLVRRVWCG